MPKPESFEDWFSLLFNFLRANATSVQTIVAEAMASTLHVAASQIQMQHHTPLSPATVSASMRPHATMQASDNQMTSTELMPSQIPSNSQLGAGPLTNASSVQTIVAEAMASMQRVVVASHIQTQHHTFLSPATVSAFMRPHATMQASDNKMTIAELMPSQIPSSNQLGAVSLSPAATSAFVQPPATMQEPFEF